MLTGERRQRARQQVRAHAGRRPDRERASVESRELLDLEARFFEALQHRASVRQERLASLGECHVALHAVKKRRAELALELADLLTDGGLGDVELLSRPREMQVAAHRFEVGELVHFHRPELL